MKPLRFALTVILITIVDANHHFEEWKFNYPGGKRMTGRFDLQRTKEASGPFGQ